MAQKIKVGIIFGGKSAEHDVSISSAKNISAALDPNKFIPVLIFINKTGDWYLCENFDAIQSTQLQPLILTRNSDLVDVAFPVLHGPFGEDGSVQGYLKTLNIPFVGSDVLGSAVGMDKDVMKRLLRDAQIPIAKFISANKSTMPSFEEAIATLNIPLYIKPANMGSSIGVHKVKTEEEYNHAMQDAFQYDTKILIEENIVGREIECAILENGSPTASVLGEIIVNRDFYSYEAKYLDETGAQLKIPADINPETAAQIQSLAIKTFQTLSCRHLARVDFFLKSNGEILVNEINTLPGFTATSMYPKLWGVSGVGYVELIGTLLRSAIKQ